MIMETAYQEAPRGDYDQLHEQQLKYELGRYAGFWQQQLAEHDTMSSRTIAYAKRMRRGGHDDDDEQSIFQAHEAYLQLLSEGVSQGVAYAHDTFEPLITAAPEDARKWQDISAHVMTHGIRNFHPAMLGCVSSDGVGWGMRVALDDFVWRQSLSDLQRFGCPDPAVLGLASSFAPYQVMSRALDPEAMSKMYAQVEKDSLKSFTEEAAYASLPDNGKFIADIVGLLAMKFFYQRKAKQFEQQRAFFSAPGANQQNAGQQHRQYDRADWQESAASSTQQPEYPDVHDLLKRIAPDLARGFGFLQREDPAAVRRVIDKVRGLREDALLRQGGMMTDQRVYRVFRAEVETSEEDNDPELLRSFTILNALMGGSLHGKIPF